MFKRVHVPLMLFVFFLTWAGHAAGAGSSRWTDDAGQPLPPDAAYRKVVSLAPSATEIIVALGAGDALAGITFHDTSLKGAWDIPLVGGFFNPSLERVISLDPDLVIVSSLNTDITDQMKGRIPFITLSAGTLDDAFRHILLLGRVFHRDDQASALVGHNRKQLELIARKTALIPQNKRKRVMRLMGREKVMTPGNDSFQNDIIRAAGGIPPDFGKTGQIVDVTRDEWVRFNPQVLYSCGEDLKADSPLFSNKGWNSVDAVKSKAFMSFPCNLTCRASTHVGAFVSWLSSRLYPEEFSDSKNEVLPRGIIRSRPLLLDLDYVKQASISTSIIHDFENKSLIIDFNRPMSLVSTLEGQRNGVMTVGNHYTPPPCWGMNHSCSLIALKQTVLDAIGKKPATSSFLFTGADMDNLSVQTETFKDMTVIALVTAGVRGNAVRMSKDTGNYYEPGTINMMFLTTMRLSPRAMTRAIISATEGKTAALQDLDIRSTLLPLEASATGTGTDNIIVVQGDGHPIDNAGGHTKMGELIAKTAYRGVTDAIARQNGIVAQRDVFSRLAERKLSLRSLLSGVTCDCQGGSSTLADRMEHLLLSPEYAGFIEAALALSDAWERHNLNDVSMFESHCLTVAGKIAGAPVSSLHPATFRSDVPEPLSLALRAMVTGILESPSNERKE